MYVVFFPVGACFTRCPAALLVADQPQEERSLVCDSIPAESSIAVASSCMNSQRSDSVLVSHSREPNLEDSVFLHKEKVATELTKWRSSM